MTDKEKRVAVDCVSDEVVSEEKKAKKTKNPIDICKQELAHAQENYFRVMADFDNYRRRTEKEKERWILVGQETLLIDLVSIIDEFDRALIEHKNKERTPEMEVWLQGFELIGKLLYKFLDKYEVKELENYHTFKPELHEALVQVESKEHETGQIVQVMQKGFTFKGSLMRHAKVSVAK